MYSLIVNKNDFDYRALALLVEVYGVLLPDRLSCLLAAFIVFASTLSDNKLILRPLSHKQRELLIYKGFKDRTEWAE